MNTFTPNSAIVNGASPTSLTNAEVAIDTTGAIQVIALAGALVNASTSVSASSHVSAGANVATTGACNISGSCSLQLELVDVTGDPRASVDGGRFRVRRYADTHTVSAEIEAHWTIQLPEVRSAPALTYENTVNLVSKPLKTKVKVKYPDPLPDVERAKVATTGVTISVKNEMLLPTTGCESNTGSCNVTISYKLESPESASHTNNRIGSGVFLRTVLLPTTVRNPTDEELVVMALNVI